MSKALEVLPYKDTLARDRHERRPSLGRCVR